MTRRARLSDRETLILTSLAEGPKHGYALIQDIEQFADVRLGAGTLYGALARLEKADLVRALAADDRRHPYEITETGGELLAEQLARSAKIARLGLRRIGLSQA